MIFAPWARLAPSLSSLCCRAVSTTATTMAAAPPAWAGLLTQGIAEHEEDPTAKYCQLATAAVGGGASCRTWVFRGFWEDTVALKFITDRRSQKVSEISADPAGEVCFYLKKTREQFRIKGRLQVVADGDSDERLAKARRHQWTRISPAAQASFATTAVPGAETLKKNEGGEGGREGEGGTKGKGQREVIKEPTEEFCLVLLWPNFVDHLELGGEQTRHTHQLEGGRDGGGVWLPGAFADDGGAGEAGARQGSVWTTTAVNP
eukprot:jgi/Undpi1/9811/HiC_scaffold_27.g12265.m1